MSSASTRAGLDAIDSVTGASVQSISSEKFKGYQESMAASAKQDYNRSHFSKMDVKDLKQEYEDFFAAEEKPPEP